MHGIHVTIGRHSTRGQQRAATKEKGYDIEINFKNRTTKTHRGVEKARGRKCPDTTLIFVSYIRPPAGKTRHRGSEKIVAEAGSQLR